MSVNFTVNGEAYSLPKGSQLSDLLAELELGDAAVTIQINRRPVMQRIGQQEINEDDRVEIALSIPDACFTGAD